MNIKYLLGVSVAAVCIGYGASHAAVMETGTNVFNPLPGGDGFIGIGHDPLAPAAGSLTINSGSTVLGRVVHIGSTVNGTGTLTLNDGTLATGAADTYNEVKIGNNGTGALNASNGGQVLMTGQPFFAVGRVAGSSGNAVFDASGLSLTVDSGTDWGASVQVGRDGAGNLALNNGSSLSIID